MLRIRIASMGAVAALAIAVAGSAANAQTATTDQPGKPLALLAGLNPPHAAKKHAAKVHVAKATSHGKIARAETHHARAAAVASEAPGKHHSAGATNDDADALPPSPVAVNRWPTPLELAPADNAPADNAPADNAATGNAPANAATAPLPAAAAVPAPDDPNAVVVNGQTVQISAPDEVNDLDRAASEQSTAEQSADTRAPQPSGDSDMQSAMTRVASATVSDDAGQNANQHASPVGSASWIAQVMAALGGAVAAGAVAWFLIGSGPVRTYG
jgi:hypothetical protein